MSVRLAGSWQVRPRSRRAGQLDAILSIMAEERWTPCCVCGAKRDVGAPSDRDWLFVEVERIHAPGYWEAVFCPEAHAAQWFGPPMPPPDHMAERPAPESRWQRVRFYLGASGVVLGVIGTLALAIYGAVSLLR